MVVPKSFPDTGILMMNPDSLVALL